MRWLWVLAFGFVMVSGARAETADARFARAVRDYDGGRYAEAGRAFESLYALGGDADAAVNAVRAYAASGDVGRGPWVGRHALRRWPGDRRLWAAVGMPAWDVRGWVLALRSLWFVLAAVLGLAMAVLRRRGLWALGFGWALSVLLAGWCWDEARGFGRGCVVQREVSGFRAGTSARVLARQGERIEIGSGGRRRWVLREDCWAF